MPNAISVHIGVNIVDPNHYSGWSGPLSACEADADVMTQIAMQQGFAATVLKTAAATRAAVTNCIADAADKLQRDDFFLLTYAGHGGQIKDVDGDEEDLKDETWCLYDGQLLDDELNILWSEFAEGVRIFVLSDSCHSGSVTKGVGATAMAKRNDLVTEDDATGVRFMPRKPAIDTFKKNRDFYSNLQYQLPDPRPPIRATVRLFSGCQDDQLSSEGEYKGVRNGRFTRTLKDLWADGQFRGNYNDFHKGIIAAMPETQQPNHLVVGEPSSDYDGQRPFTI
ncbi:MAG: caspase family protein [Pseudomonadales bacterium]